MKIQLLTFAAIAYCLPQLGEACAPQFRKMHEEGRHQAIVDRRESKPGEFLDACGLNIVALAYARTAVTEASQDKALALFRTSVEKGSRKAALNEIRFKYMFGRTAPRIALDHSLELANDKRSKEDDLAVRAAALKMAMMILEDCLAKRSPCAAGIMSDTELAESAAQVNAAITVAAESYPPPPVKPLENSSARVVGAFLIGGAFGGSAQLARERLDRLPTHAFVHDPKIMPFSAPLN